MAHHGESPLDGLSQEQLQKMFQEQSEDVFRKSMPKEQAQNINDALKASPMPGIGATGNFPDGRLNEKDEGEIMIGITTVEGRVIINFGKPVHWVGLTKEQAAQIAESLLKHSKQ